MDDQQIRAAMVGGSPEHRASWNKICDDAEEAKRKWIEGLRLMGVKAAHPDDGWVTHYESGDTVELVYPQFNDSGLDDLQVGDLIALGWPGTITRIVRCEGKIEPRFKLPWVRRDIYEVSGYFRQPKP